VAALALLGTFRERPTPVLSTMTPSTIEVHHYEMVEDPAAPLEPARPRTLITLTGSGIAHDTVAVVDAIELPCERPLGVPGAEGCRADVEGTCDGECVIDLTRPEAGGLRDNAGTYAVRLRTPAPVQGGESLSEPLFLNVSTQLPIIESMSPRGLALADLSDPDLRGLIEDAEFDGTDFARVFPDHVEVALTVCRDADNAQFRLGPNVGRVLSSSRRVPVPVDAEGACAGLDARDVVVDFGTERLVGLDPADQAIGVVNPSPGGGVGTAPFGITDVADACLAAETCIAPLTGRRPVDASGQTTYFVSRTDFPEQFAGLAWRGGDAASLLWRYRVEDVPAVLAGDRLVGQLAAMVTPETAGGVVPALLGQPFALMVQDATGRQPQASLYPVERRNDGRFAAETTVITGDPGRFPQDLLVEDFDRDGHLDALVSNCASSQLLLRRGPLEDAAQPLHAIAALTCPRALAAGDLNSDGRVDVVSLLDLPAGISTRLGRGDGTFSLPVNLRMQRSPKALALADFDRDGHVDVLTGGLEPDCEPAVPPTEDCEDRPLSRLFLRWGRGLRGFDFQRAVHLPARPNGAPLDAAGPGAEQLVVADLDLDGHPDVLAADGPTVRVFRGTGERAAPFDWFGPAADLDVRAGQRASAVAVGDINGDARPDVVVTTRDDDDDPESAVHTGTVVVFLGQGNGAFTQFATIDSDELHDVHLGDATGDGYPDVLALDRTGALRRFVGRGDGRLTASTVTPLIDGAGRFRVADANRDGVEDLIGLAAARGAERLVLRRGLGRAAFGRARPPLPTGTGPVGLVALDLDHDGHLDLASLNEEASSLSLFRGDGAGGFTRAGGDVALEIAPADAVASDVTGDGRVDLVVTTGNGQARQILRGTGAGLVALPSEITPGAGFGYFDPSAACYGPVFPRERLLAVDLDGDGTREILHGTGGVIERLGTYVADSVFDSERLPFGADCGAGFTVWDVDGRWRPVAYSAGTAAVDVSMPDGLLTLYGVRVGLAISELGQAAWRRVVDTGDVRGFVPFQIYGNGMDTTDFDADGRDELVLFGHVDDRRYSLVFHAPGHDVLTRGRLEASAIDGWYDKYEGQGVHRLAPRLADFNGDGLADEVGVIPELNVASLRLRRAYEIGYSPDDEVIPLTRAAPQGLEIGDANHDGVPDLFIANYFDDSLTTQVMPGPGEWTQTLADPMLVRAPLPAPGAVDFPLARMRQAFQMVDTISVYVDLEGEGLSAVELSLGAPDGRRVALGRGPAAGPWRAVFRGPAVDLSPLYGRQPTGDWTLWATVGDGAVGRLRDFRVVTHGAFVRAAPGATPARPRLLRFPGGGDGTRAAGHDARRARRGRPHLRRHGGRAAGPLLRRRLRRGHGTVVATRSGVRRSPGTATRPLRYPRAGAAVRDRPLGAHRSGAGPRRGLLCHRRRPPDSRDSVGRVRSGRTARRGRPRSVCQRSLRARARRGTAHRCRRDPPRRGDGRRGGRGRGQLWRHAVSRGVLRRVRRPPMRRGVRLSGAAGALRRTGRLPGRPGVLCRSGHRRAVRGRLRAGPIHRLSSRRRVQRRHVHALRLPRDRGARHVSGRCLPLTAAPWPRDHASAERTGRARQRRARAAPHSPCTTRPAPTSAPATTNAHCKRVSAPVDGLCRAAAAAIIRVSMPIASALPAPKAAR
jgi:hypothetical protein